MDKAQILASIQWRKENNLPQIPGDTEALQQIEKGETMANQASHPIEEDEIPEEVEEADPDDTEDEDPEEDGEEIDED